MPKLTATGAPAQATVDAGNGRASTNALSYWNFRMFFIAQLVSITGMWMESLAMSWLLVQTLHASAFQLGLLQVFNFGPVLLLGIPAGILADRFPKRKILQVTQVVFLLGSALTAWLVITNRIELWQVYAIATVLGVSNALDMPSRQALISELVEAPALKNAIALNAAMFNAGRLIGPSLAGIVLAKWGPGACFAINACSFLAPITACGLMRVKDRALDSSVSPIERLLEGFRYIRRTPAIMLPMGLVGISATMAMNHNVWMPLIAKNSLHASEGTYGLLFSAMGVGALAGALSIAFSREVPTFRRVLFSAAGMALSLLALAVAALIPLSVPVICVILAINGFTLPNTLAAANTIVQTNAPAEMRGRVMAVYTTIFLGTTPIGGLIAGAVAGRIGVERGMMIAATIVVVTVACFVVLARRIREKNPDAPLDAEAA